MGRTDRRCRLSLQRRRPAAKVEMGTSSHNGVDLSWIPQETLNQISTCDVSVVSFRLFGRFCVVRCRPRSPLPAWLPACT